jgi:Glycosyl hydrolase family 9
MEIQLSNGYHAMSSHLTSAKAALLAMLLVSGIFTRSCAAQHHDYGAALHKSLLYFEAQRSGRLPYNQRVTWRGHSGLTDGLQQGVIIYLYLIHC